MRQGAGTGFADGDEMKLDPKNVTLDELRQLWSGEAASLDDAALERVATAAASVERIVAGGETVYGVNTGFGSLANTRIPGDRLAEPFNASTDKAPAARAAAKTRSPANKASSAIAVEAWVPLMSARPSFGPSWRGCMPSF